ncbi:MAG: DUF1043 family protein, partial [Pseudomonadales bacterium]|nr:DUF1043 family protein [Pseudomonadales bacterium]
MYSLEILIASTLLAGIVSALFVHWINRSSGAKQHAQNLEQELSETKASYEAYRQEVFEDFSETASKFRTLNASYTELHQHLAQSANNLCGETNTISLLESPDSQDTDLSSDNTAFSEQRDSEALVAEESNLESSIVSDIQDPVADKAEVSASAIDNTSTEEQAQDSKLDTDPVTG